MIALGNHVNNTAYQVESIADAICFVAMFGGINNAVKNKAGYVVFLYQKYYEKYCTENRGNVDRVNLH